MKYTRSKKIEIENKSFEGSRKIISLGFFLVQTNISTKFINLYILKVITDIHNIGVSLSKQMH